MQNSILELAVILTIAALIGLVVKWLRLPMILAYLMAGAVIVGSGVLPVTSGNIYHLFGQLGIMFLLFLVGLEINYSSLKLVGLTSIVVGLGQVAIAGSLGIIVALILGFGSITAIYLGIMLAFSSTVVVVQLLSEKRELNSLHGKLVIGILLVQDFLAMVLLVVLAGIKNGDGVNIGLIGLTLLKGVLIFIVMLWLGRVVAPRALHRLSHSPELLFLLSIAWLFVVASMTSSLGLSVEIGGFLAGLALANSSEQLNIARRMMPLRDFFLILLFITLGSSIGHVVWSQILIPIIVLSLTVIILNPLIVMVILRAFGYHRRTMFITGLHISQISEFSLVIAAIGLSIGHFDQSIISIITVSAMVTMGLSAFFIQRDESLYRVVKKLFKWVESSNARNKAPKSYEIIIVGAHRLGLNILRSMPKKNILVIDFDPEVVSNLNRQGYQVTYGDIGDDDIIQSVIKHRPKVIISTSPDFFDNTAVISALRTALGNKIQIIVRSDSDNEALRLYRLGADFVLLPYIMSGIGLGHALTKPKQKLIEQWRKKDLQYLTGLA